MKLEVQAFWLPKKGNATDEYEDAYCFGVEDAEEFQAVVTTDKLSCRLPMRVAVADGATETSFSGLWASLLVRAFCVGKTDDDLLLDRILHSQLTWRQNVNSKALPWYAEHKREMGAYSSLLGLEMSPGEQDIAHWRCLAIGDSCLIQVRNDERIVSFPLDSSAAFSARPALLSTSMSDEAIIELPCSQSGEVRPGDSLLLLTDAVACWILRRQEHGFSPYDRLREIDSQAEWRDLVEFYRTHEMPDGQPWMRNDDATMVRCNVTGNGG